MKKVIIALLFVPLLFSCKNETASPDAEGSASEVSVLQEKIKELEAKNESKEADINAYMQEFNEIQENLNTIKDKEKIVSENAKTGEAKKKEDQIKEDIQAIYDLMNTNKQKLASINKKFKKANLKITEFEKMIERLTTQLEQKEIEISDLKTKLDALNLELASLNLSFQQVQEESSAKTEKLNTAFYSVGTAKELKENGVITKEGGFIGIGKAEKLRADFNKKYFTQVDIQQTNTIPLACKKAKLLTTHPAGSYKLEMKDKKVEKLEITNAEDFWSASKYLVIIVE